MKKLAMQTGNGKKKSYNKVAVMAAKAQISVMMAAESRKEAKKIDETLRNAERRSRIEQAILYFEEKKYENALLEFNGVILFERDFATTGWRDFLSAHPQFESYQKLIGKTRMSLTLVRESIELKPDWKEVEGRVKVYEALAAQTEDEKQKAEYQKKAGSDFAWARKLAGRNKITIIIETCMKYVFSVLLSVSNVTSYVTMLLSARRMIIANKPGKMRSAKG
jgi:hypothetical protein